MADRIVLNTISYHGHGAIENIVPELTARGYKKGEMGHQNTDAGFAPDVDDLFQCLGHVVGLIAHMHVEDAVVAGRDFGERDEFFRGLVLVGRVDEPRRNAARLPPCTGPRFLP